MYPSTRNKRNSANQGISHRVQEKMRHRKLVHQTISTAKLVPGLVENGKSRGTLGKTCKYLTDFVEFLQQLKNILIYETQSIHLSLLGNGQDIMTDHYRELPFKEIPSPQIEVEVINDSLNQDLYNVQSIYDPSNYYNSDNTGEFYPSSSQEVMTSDSGYVEMNMTSETICSNLSLSDQDILLALKSYKIKQ